MCLCFVFCLFLSDTAKCQGSPTELRLSCTWVMSTPVQFLIPLETETSGNTAELDSILVCKAETDISKQQTLIGFLDLSEFFHDLAYPSHKRKWP